MLDIAAKKTGQEKIYVLNLKGKIDSVTARDFEIFYDDILRAGHRYIIFDASSLSYVSSAGIASFVKLARRISSAGGAAVLINVNSEIRLIFEFFGLSKKIPLLADLDSARDYLDQEISKNVHSLEIEAEVKSAGRTEPDSYSSVSDEEEPAMKTGSERMHADPQQEAAYESIPEKKTGLRVSEPVIREYIESESILSPFTQSDRPETVREETGKGDVLLPQHFLIRCEQCGLNLRVYQSGPHMCPDCGIEFHVKPDGSASFYEKL